MATSIWHKATYLNASSLKDKNKHRTMVVENECGVQYDGGSWHTFGAIDLCVDADDRQWS